MVHFKNRQLSPFLCVARAPPNSTATSCYISGFIVGLDSWKTLQNCNKVMEVTCPYFDLLSLKSGFLLLFEEGVVAEHHFHVLSPLLAHSPRPIQCCVKLHHFHSLLLLLHPVRFSVHYM